MNEGHQLEIEGRVTVPFNVDTETFAKELSEWLASKEYPCKLWITYYDEDQKENED